MVNDITNYGTSFHVDNGFNFLTYSNKVFLFLLCNQSSNVNTVFYIDETNIFIYYSILIFSVKLFKEKEMKKSLIRNIVIFEM